MTQEGFKQNLTTILSWNEVDYSRLMDDDEAASVIETDTNSILIRIKP